MARHLFYEIIEPPRGVTGMINPRQDAVVSILGVSRVGGKVIGYDIMQIAITPDETEHKVNAGGLGAVSPFYVLDHGRHVLRSDGSLFKRVCEITDEELELFSDYSLFSSEKSSRQHEHALQKAQDVLSAKYIPVEQLSPLDPKVSLEGYKVANLDNYITPEICGKYALHNAAIDAIGGRRGLAEQIEHLVWGRAAFVMPPDTN